MPIYRNARIAVILIFGLGTFASRAFAEPTRSLPGYLVNNAGDTIFCEIDYKDWSQSPTSISAKVKGERRTFTTADIAAFGVTGYADFKSATVTYHPQPTTGTDFPNYFSDQVETKRLFLNILVSGPYSLYDLRISGHYVFFISQQNSDITELVYRVKLVDQVIQEDQQFRNLLLGLFRNEGIAEENLMLINRTSYNQGDIQKLVEKLNEHLTGKVSRKQNKRTRLRLDIAGGVVFQSFPSDVHAKYSTSRFPSAVSPIGGINLLGRLPSHFGALAIGLFISYSEFNLTSDKSGTNSYYYSAAYHFTTTYTEHLEMKQRQIQTSLYGMYTFNPRSQVSPYLKLGVVEHFALNSDNGIFDTFNSNTSGVTNGVRPFTESDQGTTSILSPIGFYVNVSFAAGIVAGRHRLEIMTEMPSGNIGPESTVPFRITTFGLCYYYALKR